MTSYFVAIDSGSQSTKVLVVDEGGTVHASARIGLKPYEHPSPGLAVHPGDDLWESITSACQTALSRFAGPREKIVGVGLCTIRYCRALIATNGTLVEPVLSWMDKRVGLPHSATHPGVAKLAASSGYITHRLVGRFVDSAAAYQGMWPIDQHSWRWSEDPSAFMRTGMSPEMLCDLVDPGDLLGTITPAAAAATGLAIGLPVFATANDKAVEALGAGLTSPNQLLLSLGTYISSLTPATGYTEGTSYWSNFASRPHQYLAESEGIRRGMWTVSWFRSLLEGASPEDMLSAGILSEGTAPEGTPREGTPARGDRIYEMEALLDAEAAALPPGSDGLFAVLDWLAPAAHPTRRGALLGFSGTQGRAHIYRSILEGIALTMADNAEAMAAELNRSFDTVIVSGGGARSRILPQVMADVLGLSVRSAETDDAAGIGAAICAAVGSGTHPDWDTAVDAMTRLSDPLLPSANAAVYARLRPRHRRVREEIRRLSATLYAEE
ncbi:FGGY-family carbohydrate kinase [Lysinibacter sp. HNR]|uniref:FGGY-family carbohydrate kinase n=1 Tax=Lysinibacter sp. HNR TaxID=3031408 RepID=UPI002434CD0D|nr:FGGY-family carbohydrate kinase [Lysinibacter sp. HNR]WGD37528.1 FGGY-family carbohydrate kinase [Lysinibacter sp. HNR]